MAYRHGSPRIRGFHLFDLGTLVVVLIGLLALYAIRAEGPTGRESPRVKNATNLASIMKRLTVIGTESTNEAWTGSADASTRDKFHDMFVRNAGELKVSQAPANADMWAMSPMLGVNPRDRGIAQPWPGRGEMKLAKNLNSGDGHISYATTKNRFGWKNTLQASVITISDRLVAGRSVFNSKAWEGAIAYGDAHVSHEKTRRHTVLLGTETKTLDIFDPNAGVAMTYD